MKKLIALFLAVALCATMFAGCTPTVQEPSGDDQQQQQPPSGDDQKPTDGGDAEDASATATLNLAMPGSSTERFQSNGGDYGDMANYLLYSRLLRPDGEGNPVYFDLATDLEVTENDTVFTFTLRDGAKWHDGEAVTPEDVKATIMLHAGGYSVNTVFRSALSFIKGYEAVAEGADDIEGIAIDGNKITFTLTQPCSTFKLTMSQMNILPAHLVADEDPLTFQNSDFWANPIGSGQYKLTEFVPNDYAMLAPFEDYYGAKPKIQNIKLDYTQGTDALVSAQSGELHYRQSMSAETALEIEKLGNYTVTPVDIYYIRYLMWNSKGPQGNGNDPISDIRVRRAILHAIDRQAIVEELFQGYASVIDAKVPPSFSYANKDVYSYDYDVEKAKSLCAEAGYDMSTPLKLACYYTDQQSIDVCESMVYYLNEAGFNVELVFITGDLVSGIYDTKDYNIVYAGLSAMGPEEAYSSLSGKFIKGSTMEKVVPTDPNAIDPLYDELLQTVDADKRTEILKQLQAAEYEVLYHLPLFAVQAMTIVRSDLVDTGDLKFGNEWFNYERNFETWSLKKVG